MKASTRPRSAVSHRYLTTIFGGSIGGNNDEMQISQTDKILMKDMAEEVGFEPTVRSHARRFSRPVHSTTLPLLRSGPF